MHPPDSPLVNVNLSWKDGLLGLLFDLSAVVIFTAIAVVLAPPQAEPPGLPTNAIDNLTMLGAVWIVAVRWRRTSWTQLGLAKPRPHSLLVGAVLALSYLAASTAFFAIIAGSWDLKRVYAPALPDEAALPWLSVLLYAAITPFAEELFYRSFLYASFRKRPPFRFAALASAIIFAGTHHSIFLFLPTCVLGYLLARLYESSRSIWPGVLAHSLINLAIQMLLLS